jgi:hypothetical protein
MFISGQIGVDGDIRDTVICLIQDRPSERYTIECGKTHKAKTELTDFDVMGHVYLS